MSRVSFLVGRFPGLTGRGAGYDVGSIRRSAREVELHDLLNDHCFGEWLLKVYIENFVLAEWDSRHDVVRKDVS